MLSYIGGKSRIAPQLIIPNIPTDIENFVEVFGGMFWTFFSMDLSKYPNLKKVVYNDFNPLNYNLFKCVQNPTELLKSINSIDCQKQGVDITPSIYKEQFVKFQADLFSENVKQQAYDYDMAAKYVYILTQVFSGSKPETSSFIDLKGKYKSKYLTFRDKLSKPDWIEHFLKITDVENMDFDDVITKYDSPTTYFYVDPPYFKTENYYSNHDFDRNDHGRLANTLKNIKGKFSLSYYDFELLHTWFPEDQYRWEKKEFAKAAAAKKGVSQNMGEELLIMNYNLV
jgi:DNA adenine methylase